MKAGDRVKWNRVAKGGKRRIEPIPATVEGINTQAGTAVIRVVRGNTLRARSEIVQLRHLEQVTGVK